MNYNIHINDFEGPFDLLLHLVKVSKMDIYEIDTKKIIDDYLDYVRHYESLNIEVASTYLVMASELLHLKSKLLINETVDEEEDSEFNINSEEDLKNRLIEYEQYKNVTGAFKELEEKRSEVYTKAPEKITEFGESFIASKGTITLDDLVNAFLEYQSRIDYLKPINTKITKKELSVEERTKSIRNILKSKRKVNFLELFDIMDREYVIVTFLSILDMCKNNEINITQDNNFSPIFIEESKL